MEEEGPCFVGCTNGRLFRHQINLHPAIVLLNVWNTRLGKMELVTTSRWCTTVSSMETCRYGDVGVWEGRGLVCNMGGEVPVWRYGDMQVWEHGVMGICGVCIYGRPQRGSVCVYGGGESVWGAELCGKVPKRCGSLGVG